ncbi:ABC transporter [Arthrobacter sp. YN]|nr:ABC transporter [Arthrobacter sp. YN]
MAAPPRKSPLRKLLKDPQAVITSLLLLVIIVLGLLTPWIAPHDPNEAQLSAINAAPGTPDYPLGADQNGRDIASRLLHSINTSVIAGLIGAGVALVMGVTFGLIGGYFGRRLRSVTEWVFSLIMTFPGLLLLIVLMPVTKGDYRATMLIFGVLLSPGVYRIVRNLVVGVKNELYVDAARVSGLSNLRILSRHVLFVVRGPIIIAAAFLIGSAISLQSGLAFLGVGSNLVPSFGAMIADGFTNLYVDSTQFIWPSVMLGTLTASLVLLGNSLRDAFEGVKLKPSKVSTPTAARSTEENPSDETTDLLSVKDLVIAYPTPSGALREVVKGVNLTLRAGETLGLVGESGSGKTQTAFSILGVLPTEAVVTRGAITLEGRNLLGLSEQGLRALRGRDIAYIPQEPMSNLDPSYTIGAQLVEGIRASARMSRGEATSRVLALLERVGIEHPRRTFDSYPHQISGGMAQRVLIAGAVASRPKLLIADEPTTALDVTVQAEILDLIRDLQTELNMAVLLVTHNFGVVADICDRIAVMQDGRVVESGTAMELFHEPKHSYTQMLLGSILDEHTVRTDQPMPVGTATGEMN